MSGTKGGQKGGKAGGKSGGKSTPAKGGAKSSSKSRAAPPTSKKSEAGGGPTAVQQITLAQGDVAAGTGEMPRMLKRYVDEIRDRKSVV